MCCSPAQVRGFSYSYALAAMAKEDTLITVALSPLAVGGVRDHNIISRQEGTCWWNMREAEDH